MTPTQAGIRCGGPWLNWGRRAEEGARTGSKTPGPLLLMLAEGSMPRLPVSMDAASDRMSPKMLPVTIVSKDFGLRMICIAALSTYLCRKTLQNIEMSSISGAEAELGRAKPTCSARQRMPCTLQVSYQTCNADRGAAPIDPRQLHPVDQGCGGAQRGGSVSPTNDKMLHESIEKSSSGAHVGQLHIGVLLANAGDNLAPQLRHLQHVGLVHRHQPVLPLPRQPERRVRNALDLQWNHHQMWTRSCRLLGSTT